MRRGKPYRMKQEEKAKARTRKRISKWYKYSDISEAEMKKAVGINAETRVTCSCDWCTPEHWTLSRQGRRHLASTKDQLKEVDSE